MPQAILQRDRVTGLLPQPISTTALEEILSLSKAELEAQDLETLTISVTPDRLDLLSEGGLGLYLEGATEAAKGIPRPRVIEGLTPTPAFEVDPSVRALRPAIAGVVVTAPSDAGLDEPTLAEAVRYQELLHATLGRDRRAASLGIYPLDRLTPPFRYALEAMSGVRFVPLDASEEISGEEFFRDHPMAAKYGALGRIEHACLTIRDSKGTVLSLPPILNGRTGGEARVGDRVLLLESTGVRAGRVREALGLLLVVFVSRGWSVSPVVLQEGGKVISDGRDVFTSRSVDLPAPTLHTLSGTEYGAGEVERRLSRLRLTAHAHGGGWAVDVPAWRPDLLTAVDLAEEVILAQAIRPEDGILPPAFGRGHRRRETIFRRRVASMLLGLGLAAPYTSVLVAEDAVQRVRGANPIRLTNPPSAEFAYARDRLLLSHIGVLSRNTRHAYPQVFGEVGPVIVPQPAAEAGADTRYHGGVMIAREGAGFADAAALVDYVLRALDIGAVREPAELPGTIPGRAARVRVAGEVVAEVGELHPEILTGVGVPVPVAWAELDLTQLFPLLDRRE
jgi:phenylalanyl-tRNA synthetase beta chain